MLNQTLGTVATETVNPSADEECDVTPREILTQGSRDQVQVIFLYFLLASTLDARQSQMQRVEFYIASLDKGC